MSNDRATASATTSPSAPVSTDSLRARLMAEALGRLLNRVPGSRSVLLHLSALERGLLQKGLSAIGSASQRSLERILQQLRSLPLGGAEPPLIDLLQRIERALGAAHRSAAEVPFDIEATVVISEVSHSEFMAAGGDEYAPTVFEPRL